MRRGYLLNKYKFKNKYQITILFLFVLLYNRKYRLSVIFVHISQRRRFMPFCINDDQRLSVNLSEFANYIIETDMVTFSVEHRSTFINRILENFIDKAKSTISNSSDEYRANLEEKLSNSDINIKEYKNIIDALVNDYVDSIKNKKYKKGNSFKIRLNNGNTEYFKGAVVDSKYYDNTLGAYVNALIEEYAELNYKDREAIIYRKEFEKITSAIRDEKLIKPTLIFGETLKIKPYKLLMDNQKLYYYLVGYGKESGKSVSYRIIDFESITCQQGKAVLTKSDIENIEKELRNKGVQFMRGESQEIKIRLNEDGQKLYNRILHLRPKYIRIEEENIYVFDCSLKQIEYYFLSLVKRLKLSHHLN